MVFQIQRGLFSSEFVDHYALLGMPVISEAKDIRKGYLKVARLLHPDSAALTSPQDKQFAEQLLSKLINPAWECLAQEKSKIEYDLLLKLKGKAAAGDVQATEGLSPVAQSLMDKSDVELEYRALVQALTAKQFANLSQCEEVTAQLSELNLVYLVKTEGRLTGSFQRPASFTPPASSTGTSAGAPPGASSPPQQPKPATNPYAARQSLAEPYFSRAEIAFKRQNYPQAVLELRDALKLEPDNGRFHSLLGMVYLEQKQGTMARIHFDKALSLHAEDPMALQGKQMLQKMTAKTASSSTAKPKGETGSKDSKSPGLFGGLFGKKK
jgi:curved DNA-binding protein CbpA